MKKFLILFLAIIFTLSLSACNEKTQLSFAYTATIEKDYNEETGTIQFLIEPPYDIDNLAFDYNVYNKDGEICDSGYFNAGNVLTGYKYRFIVAHYEDYETYSNQFDRIEITSISGKAK